MSAFAQDQERRLIPRWRFADQLGYSAEFTGDPRIACSTSLDRQHLEQKLADWKLRQDFGSAIDLVSCGLGGGWISEVRPAAAFLAKNAKALTPQTIGLIERALDPRDSSESTTSSGQLSLALAPDTFSMARSRVAGARQRTQRNPRNVLAWLDLSRGHAILGNSEKSVKAIERALFLAPNHRHALRAASRCFIHAGELDRAHSLLAKNRRTANDPWLIAAEIAAAKVANRDPKYARAGRRLLDSGHLPPDHLTELLSAMGTLEYYSGSDRRARKYLHASLEAPTDNVVAQARWLRTKVSGIAIQDAAFALPLSFEARCWRALEDASWEYAKLECQHWLFDEPFSSRPARLGSYIGISLTSDHEFSEASALAGLRTNPLDATLRNNLAVALAYQGRVAEAIEQFSSIKLPLPGDLPPFVYLATTGLLRFRSRDIVGGRELYRKAEHWAPLDMKGQVAIFHAREELEANTTDAFECVERARKMNENSRIRGAIRTLELLQERAAQRIPRNENLDIDTATHESDARLYPIVAKSNAIIESRDTVLSIPGHHASRTISVVVGTSLDPGREAGGLVRRVEPQRHRNGRPDRANEESFGDRGQSSIQRGRKGKKRE